MVADYSSYKALFAAGITELGCWAHARRKFVELEKASGSVIATEAIRRIGALYHIEQEAKALDDSARYTYRQQHAKPLVDAFHTWLLELQPKVLGSSGTAKAIHYCLRRWEALARYLDNGHYPIDNHPAENVIRPIALGRKNWLFAGSESAGRRAAAIMSLLATATATATAKAKAKANGHDPHAWLCDVLERLPTTRACRSFSTEGKGSLPDAYEKPRSWERPGLFCIRDGWLVNEIRRLCLTLGVDGFRSSIHPTRAGMSNKTQMETLSN